VRIDVGPLKDIADWVESYRRFWDVNFERLDEYLQTLQAEAKGQAGIDTSEHDL
jgi:hypothetical protein